MPKEIPLAEEMHCATWVHIDKGAIFLLATQLSYLLSDERLFLHPSWLDSMPNSIYIGCDEAGLISIQTREFGTVNLPTFCSLLRQSHTQASMESVSIMESPEKTQPSSETIGPKE